MWLLVHFMFVHFCQPSAWMHVFACIGFGCLTSINTKRLSLKDVVPSLAVFGMYVGYYLTQELWHWAYLPWWVVTICGFRKQKGYISAGGILLGFILHFFDMRVVIGHFIMNVSRMLKINLQSMASLSMVHIVLAILSYFTDSYKNNWYIDLLGGISAIVCSCFKMRMDIFSIGMLFSNPFALGLTIIHAGSPFWYEYYKNNNYRKVKYSFLYVYPILILLVLWFRQEIYRLRAENPF
jgi:hypothetical protein